MAPFNLEYTHALTSELINKALLVTVSAVLDSALILHSLGHERHISLRSCVQSCQQQFLLSFVPQKQLEQ